MTIDLKDLNLVNDAVIKFQAVQTKYKEHGACSNGPSEVFKVIVYRALCGDDFKIPRNGRQWLLYTESNEAADALHHATLCVVQAIWACPIKGVKELKEYFDNL